jgi:hypothetical protein
MAERLGMSVNFLSYMGRGLNQKARQQYLTNRQMCGHECQAEADGRLERQDRRLCIGFTFW